jgi:hypothetical protein
VKQEETMLRIVKYAVKAPSCYNTQPWRFKIRNDTICLLPDFTRALPVVDRDDHALYISLGCVLENLVLAANEFNYETKIEITGNEKKPQIMVTLYDEPEAVKSELFDYILKRQARRNKYSNDEIPDNLLSELFNDPHDEGVRTRLFLSRNEIKWLVPYILESTRRQFSNKAFVDELVSWVRFSEKEAMLKGDGILAASMGLPNTGRFIGNIIIKHFISADREAGRMEQLTEASSGLALFMAEENDPYHWIRLGQAFQRFGLKAAKYEISHSHLDMPCDVLRVRAKLIHDLELKDLTPLLLIRFGHSRPMPYSFRRSFYKLLDP